MHKKSIVFTYMGNTTVTPAHCMLPPASPRALMSLSLTTAPPSPKVLWS